MSSPTSKFNLPTSIHRGFTMIELLVTMGIFMVLTGVVLANYRGFDSNAVFANASEDIVLALRQAQVYGAGTKGAANCYLGTSFECAYGVHFSMSYPHDITIFIDRDNNRKYDTAMGGAEDVEIIKWKSSISLTGLRCGVINTDCFGSMDITFKRPSPDAYIADASFPTPPPSSGFDKGWIILTDTNTGKISTTTITSAGQISLQ